ncbi:M20/M25/M40 family metallo-hydrolase [Phaeodactylibacter xiamenensis]|jgi:Zn-dependent M28 family amino/carboxypeptidase|uniref:M20/M25/M40 family metallo-hydrolase n=1 Tax=Phaeodactylibacter xiamenensis TaxID=1524460 RepID=UPI0024A91E25|nr:M20/M25/M40 family metallo-hydrolase [Phaeodactylibacter xiamenensis]
MKYLIASSLLLISVGAFAQANTIVADSLMSHVRFLSSDALKGRETDSEGNAAAAAYILQRFEDYGLMPAGKEGYRQPFQFYSRFPKKTYKATNLLAMVRGTEAPDSVIVISAHYDHVGERGGEVYNGADDNASGVGALLELARYFKANPAPYSLLFAAWDAEEVGLRGANHFVDEPTVPLEQIILNINMDMIGRNAKEQIYICGAGHYPKLRAPLDRIAKDATIQVGFGHESPTPTRSDDWTYASDHGEFHKKNIPFLYFGVEDHEDYHQPTDDADRIMPVFYTAVAEVIRKAILHFARP